MNDKSWAKELMTIKELIGRIEADVIDAEPAVKRAALQLLAAADPGESVTEFLRREINRHAKIFDAAFELIEQAS